jgi:hypothetical protein
VVEPQVEPESAIQPLTAPAAPVVLLDDDDADVEEVEPFVAAAADEAQHEEVVLEVMDVDSDADLSATYNSDSVEVVDWDPSNHAEREEEKTEENEEEAKEEKEEADEVVQEEEPVVVPHQEVIEENVTGEQVEEEEERQEETELVAEEVTESEQFFDAPEAVPVENVENATEEAAVAEEEEEEQEEKEEHVLPLPNEEPPAAEVVETPTPTFLSRVDLAALESESSQSSADFQPTIPVDEPLALEQDNVPPLVDEDDLFMDDQTTTSSTTRDPYEIPDDDEVAAPPGPEERRQGLLFILIK